MSAGWVIFYIFLFAVVAAILYAWGLVKAQRQSNDLMHILYVKGERTVVKAISKNGQQSYQELQKKLQGLRASQFYSKNRIAIQDSKVFTDALLKRLIEKNILYVKFEDGSRIYRLTDEAKEKLNNKRK